MATSGDFVTAVDMSCIGGRLVEATGGYRAFPARHAREHRHTKLCQLARGER
jgi:hypothetical protein